MSLKFTLIEHPELNGKHALFSPSQCSWIRYDEEKIEERIKNRYRTQLGTEIHEYAATEINLRHKKRGIRNTIKEIESFIYNKYVHLSDNGTVPEYAMNLITHLGTVRKEVFEALECYINDGVGYKMNTEWPIKYSDEVFGHADTLSFRDNFLRIHDMKTGDNPAHMEQLQIYAALFCLEYGPMYNFKPSDIQIELRLYQWDEIIVFNPTVEDILPIIDKIVTINKISEKIDKEE